MKLENYLKRSSIRNFTGKKMSIQDIELLSKVINNSPTSENHQFFSAVIVKDQEMLNWISKKNWNQEHIKKAAIFIVFVADKYRYVKVNEKNNVKKNKKLTYYNSTKAFIDATIACTYAMNAAIELGYGTTIVGGVQGFGEELNEKLELPENAYSILGLSIGHIKTRSKINPKTKKVFLEKYDKTKSYNDFIKYDKDTYKEFAKKWKTGIVGAINSYSNPKKKSPNNTYYVRSSKYLKKAIKN